jgi:hypothetical protein
MPVTPDRETRLFHIGRSVRMVPVRQKYSTTKEVPTMKISTFTDLGAASLCVEPVGISLAGIAGAATA